MPIAEIEALLSGDPCVTPDLQHSVEEDRFIAVGRNAQGRALFVAFTFRTRESRRLIRPVSARYMHKKEVEAYETEGAQIHHGRGGGSLSRAGPFGS